MRIQVELPISKMFFLPWQVLLVEGPFEDTTDAPSKSADVRHPVDLHLDWVLGKMPKKVTLEEKCFW